MNDGRACRPKVLQWVIIGVFAFGGAYYLWEQHRAHILQYLPLALFLLCPLMHLFPGGCHGHKKHGNSEENSHEGRGHHA